MPGPTNHQTPPSVNSPSSSPGPIAQQLVQLQGAGQTPPNLPQPTTAPGKVPSNKGDKPWKEAREWLNIIGILLIPLLIGIYTIINNTQQTTLAQQQHTSDQHIAQQNRQADVANQLDQQRETALKTYEDDISSLLLYQHLATSRPRDEIRTIALAKTLEVLHQLDGPRNDRAIQFLQDAQLIGADLTPAIPYDHNIINFSSADLKNDDLSGTDLSGTDLSGTKLNGAILHVANLTWAELNGAELNETMLRDANLTKADLSGAKLIKADLIGAKLIGAKLIGAKLRDANLTRADLSGANLTRADLTGADLSGATMPNGTRHSCQQGEEFYCP
jgi:uncharacterized protein YjbI with pentapeptide repeats